MPRKRRISEGGIAYHVYNRAIEGHALFDSAKELDEFVALLAAASMRYGIEILAYCLMSNHWHLILFPGEDGSLSAGMGWLQAQHARTWRSSRRTRGRGHVYSSRYGAVPVQDRRHLEIAMRYVERNALSAGLVTKAQEWRWCSLHLRTFAPAVAAGLLSDRGMTRALADWTGMVNATASEKEERELEQCLKSGRAFGTPLFRARMSARQREGDE